MDHVPPLIAFGPGGTVGPVEPPGPDALPSGECHDEAALVARLRQGDDRAFEIVVRRHGGRLLSVAIRLLRDREEARDALQDGLVCAFRAIGSFSGEAMLSTWLHRIVVNAALMKLRSRSRRPEEPIEPLLPTFLDDGHHAQIPSPWGETGHESIEREQRRERVRACIDLLPDSYRTVLLLRDIEELDTTETAQILGITDNAVKVRLHRARQALRGLLDPFFRKGDLR